MRLAKLAFDVGLFYDGDLDPVLDHWRDVVGVAYDEMLPLGGGVRQHRHRHGDSIVKVNHSREPLTAAPPSGYAQLCVAGPRVEAAADVSDAQGNRIRLAPADAEALRLELRTAEVSRAAHFYHHVLELERLGENVFACGSSRLEIVAGPAVEPHPMGAPGFRYITVQVFDVMAEHAGILARGGREARAPVRLGDVAAISFVHDPDGNWIEISQRRSLVGSLD